MSKRSSLSEALRQASGKTEESKPQEVPVQIVQPSRIPSRRGKKTIAGFFDPAVSRQLKQIALEEEGSSVQELLREAINDLFEKRGKSRIA
jgi:hypothetical protein